MAEHRCQEGQHHRRRRRVRHEHREQTRDEDKAQQHVVTLVAEGFEQHLCQLCVQSRLRRCDGKDETADEQHDDRVGEGRHHRFVRQQGAHLVWVTHPFDTTVRGEEQHQSDNRHGGSP